ncbi:MAG: PhoH family protein [Planctomycetota bacterium]|nr:MAG: PhoH family protein [Planctomycetota bacterium]
MSEANINLSDPAAVLTLLGPQDQYARLIREHFGVAITHRDGKLKIIGEEEAVRRATQLLEELQQRSETAGQLTLEDVEHALGGAQNRSGALATTTAGHADKTASRIHLPHQQRSVHPKSEGQSLYVETMRRSDVTLCRGPAGSGKTYLAVALAVESLKRQLLRKIVLVRPAVEAGENLGFLPGDLQAKLNPYMRPLLDALNDMLDFDQVKYLMENDVIEVIPLAYMRGRTLNDAFIILDEAQNTTSAQMKMFLTRMGEGSKIVVTGDDTQVDLPAGIVSGLRDAWQRLQGISGIGFVSLQTRDIVRHALVQKIVAAYEKSPQTSRGNQTSSLQDDHSHTHQAEGPVAE